MRGILLRREPELAAKGLREPFAAHPDGARDFGYANIGPAETDKRERQFRRDRVLRTKPQLDGSGEPLQPLIAAEMRVGHAFCEFSGAAAESLRRIDKRVAPVPRAASQGTGVRPTG